MDDQNTGKQRVSLLAMQLPNYESRGSEIVIIKIRNKALLAKWLWHFSLEPDSLRHRIIVSKHGSLPFEWTTKGVKATFRNPLKDISFELATFLLIVLWGMVPKKVRFFIWQNLLGQVNTIDRLVRRTSLDGPFCCTLFQKAEEDLDHHFWDCQYARAVWSSFLRLLSINFAGMWSVRVTIEEFLLRQPFKDKRGVL
ncbi:peroxin Pex14 isoform X3 [Cucumis melo var. makuwa]|uniref:Peroxin Pex14 isoform X3 n=1 Tax=Cucumis melo var. makuwa TaxID=1194695 RepID=A0A5D3C4A7_CUCMM|nr:peroxin Pex14 isoform X3 [Cucumis melo var. makuwa]